MARAEVFSILGFLLVKHLLVVSEIYAMEVTKNTKVGDRDTEKQMTSDSEDDISGGKDYPECNYTVWKNSKDYFKSRLESQNPNFVQFRLTWDNNVVQKTVPGIFKPKRWVWTYATQTLSFPYITWNVDHGVLSFRLLDTKTTDIKFVHLNVTTNAPCTMTLGSETTTHHIVQALLELINITEDHYKKYENNYFCYLAETPGARDTLGYWAGLYLNYPTPFISYNCCSVTYSYTNNSFVVADRTLQWEKWTFCTLGPYIIGLVIFLFIFPFAFLESAAAHSRSEDVTSDDEYDHIPEFDTNDFVLDEDIDSQWTFQDSCPPRTFFGTLNSCFCLTTSNTLFCSRIRRFVLLLLAPCFIYIRLMMYRGGLGIGSNKIPVKEFLDDGTPMGFLALLGDHPGLTFAPAFGGPIVIASAYYVIGFIFLVLPQSLNQITEYGMPKNLQCVPLFLGVTNIFYLSGISVYPAHGFEKASTVCRSSFYMLFYKRFWIKVRDIQCTRFLRISALDLGYLCFLKVLILPLLLCFMVLETLTFVIFYAVPCLGFVVIMIKGASKSLLNLRLHYRVVGYAFRNPLFAFLVSVSVIMMYIFFSYAVCLIFIESFSFISQVTMFCFLSVIMYPSVSFGYLFFFVVILFYLVHLVRCFGDGYLELLTMAVEISTELESGINSVSVFENELQVSNVVATGINRIRVNDCCIELSRDVQTSIRPSSFTSKTRHKRNLIGIPTELFDYLVRKFKPVHVEFLKVFFQLSLITTLVFVTLSIEAHNVSGVTSEISEVMHVVFLVTVGALPRVLEVAMRSQSEIIRHEIFRREMEYAINKYWRYKLLEDGTNPVRSGVRHLSV